LALMSNNHRCNQNDSIAFRRMTLCRATNLRMTFIRIVKISVTSIMNIPFAKCHSAECHSAECHSAKCRSANCHSEKCHGTQISGPIPKSIVTLLVAYFMIVIVYFNLQRSFTVVIFTPIIIIYAPS